MFSLFFPSVYYSVFPSAKHQWGNNSDDLLGGIYAVDTIGLIGIEGNRNVYHHRFVAGKKGHSLNIGKGKK